MSVDGPTIGILAGMGPSSTGPFIDLVVAECQRQYGARHDIDFPKMFICSQPAPFYEDRPVDHTALQAATLAGLHDLERAGADFIAMACNTVHIYYDALAAALTTPLLNMITVAVDSIPPTANAVGLVAARPTTESGIYQDSLRASGYTVLDHGWQDQVDHLLGLIRDSPTDHELTAAWRPIMEPITAAGADCVLVACLDLTAVIRHSSPAMTMIDAGNSLAAEIVRLWLHQRQPGARSLP